MSVGQLFIGCAVQFWRIGVLGLSPMALLMNVNDVRHDLHKIRGTRTMCAELFVKP